MDSPWREQFQLLLRILGLSRNPDVKTQGGVLRVGIRCRSKTCYKCENTTVRELATFLSQKKVLAGPDSSQK